MRILVCLAKTILGGAAPSKIGHGNRDGLSNLEFLPFVSLLEAWAHIDEEYRVFAFARIIVDSKFLRGELIENGTVQA